jgi:hypothetical protein
VVSTSERYARSCEPRLVGWPRQKAAQTEMRILPSRRLLRLSAGSFGSSASKAQPRQRGVAPGLPSARETASYRRLGRSRPCSEARPTTTTGARRSVGGLPNRRRAESKQVATLVDATEYAVRRTGVRLSPPPFSRSLPPPRGPVPQTRRAARSNREGTDTDADRD